MRMPIFVDHMQVSLHGGLFRSVLTAGDEQIEVVVTRAAAIDGVKQVCRLLAEASGDDVVVEMSRPPHG